MTKVTYTPRENGDPIETSIEATIETKGSGPTVLTPTVIRFSAGQAVDIPDTTVVEIVERITKLDKEGNEVGKGVARRVKLSEHLRGNPYFAVEGSKQAQPAKQGKPRLPQTAEEYRGWALKWFQTCTSPTELGERWAAEASLREKLGVHEGGDVISFLRPFYESRFDDLKKAAA